MATPNNNDKPHIILIHGAWHTPATFTSLKARLTSLGYSVSSPFLPSVNSSVPVPDTTADVNVIRNAIAHALDALGKNVVLVPHSYGGIPASDACEGFSTAERTKQGKNTSVTHIVYLAAFNLVEGQTLMDSRLGIEASFLDFASRPGWLLVSPSRAAEAFYNSMPVDDARKHVADLRPQSPGTFVTKQKYAAWRYVASTVVMAYEDLATLPVMQERMFERMRDNGWTGEVVRVRGQHCLHLSHEEVVVRVVRRAAGEAVNADG